MKQEKILMGMTVRIEIVDPEVHTKIFERVFCFFRQIDEKFSTYKIGSEISRINAGKLRKEDASDEMKEIFNLSEETRKDTGGYFNIARPDKILDPSGIVKGWAIQRAVEIIKNAGYKNFYIDAGGDIQTEGKNKNGLPWKIGIRNPFKIGEIVKAIILEDKGVATSGSYVRGNHIYDPLNKSKIANLVSMTVIGPNIYEADRFATAAFAMGKEGINFIENYPGLEGYMIDSSGIATMTTGFEKYVLQK